MPTKKTDKIIEPIDAPFEAVAKAVARPKVAIKNTNEINDLVPKMTRQLATSNQVHLDLGIEVQRDVLCVARSSVV